MATPCPDFRSLSNDFAKVSLVIVENLLLCIAAKLQPEYGPDGRELIEKGTEEKLNVFQPPQQRSRVVEDVVVVVYKRLDVVVIAAGTMWM